jgi:hypothetical protein
VRQRTTTGWTEARAGASPRLRVVIESADPALAVSDFSQFTRAGIDVALCCGPGDSRDCPLLRDEDCALAAGADAVLHKLGHGGTPVLEAMRDHPGGTPVVVLDESSSVEGQIDAVRRAALTGRRRREM